MKKYILLFLILITTPCFSDVELEIKGVEVKNKTNEKNELKLDLRSIISAGDYSLFIGNYNSRNEEKNSLKNIGIMYDSEKVKIESGYQIIESNDNTFSEVNSIFSKASTDIKYKKVIFTPFINGNYSMDSGKKESYKYGAGAKLGFFLTEKVDFFSSGEYYERDDSRWIKEEAGVRGECNIGELKVFPELSGGYEKREYEEGESYIRTNLELNYNISENIKIIGINYNETSKSYFTNKTTLIGSYELDRCDLGISRVVTLISYNDKNVYKFKRCEISANKFFHNVELEGGVNVRESNIREVYGAEARTSLYFLGLNKLYLDIKKENITKYIVDIGGNTRYEIGIIGKF